ncbi:MAG: sulfur carrier protein ThiS [Rhizobiaceae bacterium]|nr:sulfur carrier protein ThiS [Rhizobiaceae bacterium]
MTIVLNGEKVDIKAASLIDALVELGYQDAKIATALNEEFVPETLRATIVLNDGDRLEILAPMQGG